MVLISDISIGYLPGSLGFDSKDRGKKEIELTSENASQAELEPQGCRTPKRLTQH